MADIRIKDLTTTASSTASDDFFAADGTTNGTRKLSAYSPSFGGNVTVSGTLTASGSLVVSGKTTFGSSSSSAGTATIDSGGNYGLVLRGSTGAIADLTLTQDGGSIFLRNEVGTNNVVLPGIVKATGTTASTSTSSGALVVGNGTSGGLGVGGSAFIGGNATVGGANVTLGTLASIPSGAYFSVETNSTEGFLTSYNGTSSVYLPINYRATEHKFTSNGVVKVLSTTASTSTSTGALVVSGGVGVAKELYVGGTLTVSGATSLSSGGFVSYGSLTLGASYASLGGGFQTSYDSSVTRIFYGDGTGYSLKFATRASSTTTDRATLTDTGSLTVAGSLTTGTPTGGTAAAWKLGTVATVSPTSPNRTIEVDIGGTIYYIHAKTTNN